MYLCFKFYIKYLNLLFNFGLALKVELLLEEKKTENKSEWTQQSTYQSYLKKFMMKHCKFQ